MKRWEYLVQAYVQRDPLNTEQHCMRFLDDTGSLGWELVSVVPGASPQVDAPVWTCVFKRPVRQGESRREGEETDA